MFDVVGAGFGFDGHGAGKKKAPPKWGWGSFGGLFFGGVLGGRFGLSFGGLFSREVGLDVEGQGGDEGGFAGVGEIGIS